jgi:DNA-binding response OmpR family regulator
MSSTSWFSSWPPLSGQRPEGSEVADLYDGSLEDLEDFASAPTVSLQRPAASRPRLVLAIDDSSTVRTIIEHSLARIGVRVASFADGLSALRALMDGQVPVPDLVLLDISLPGFDGYQIASVLRSNDAFADTPFVMLSGRDGIVDRVRTKLIGARGFIRKPFRTMEFVAAMREYLSLPPEDTSGADGL